MEQILAVQETYIIEKGWADNMIRQMKTMVISHIAEQLLR